MAQDPSEWTHGTASTYARGCKCRPCKDARAAYSREYRERNRKPRKKRSDAGVKKGPVPHGTVSGYSYHKCRCPDCRLAKTADNRKRKSGKEEHLREYYRKYRMENPDKIERYSEARKQAPFNKESIEYSNIIRRDPCSYCGEPFEHLDHIVPVSRGGDSLWNNLTSACAPCNSSKSNKPLLEYLLYRLKTAETAA